MKAESREEKFAAIFGNDSLGLLRVEPTPTKSAPGENQQLIDGFQKISDFFESNGRVPDADSPDLEEFTLASRLKGIKKDPKKVKILQGFDFYHLLDGDDVKSISLEDLITDDPLDLLSVDDDVTGLFTMKHVQPTDRIRPDYIARRKVCKDFDLYEAAFEHIHADLESGRRRLIPFNRNDLKEGAYYVLRGVALYLAVNNAELTEKVYNDELYRRQNGRTRCIFDNGTESSMLFQSLIKAMQQDGFSISEVIERPDSMTIGKDDQQCGYIYVLRSLSRNPQIRQIKNLYKIGYCSGDVTTRIKNAVNEPTYLMSEVEIVSAVRCYNMDVPKLESAVHDFFAASNQEFEIRDEFGQLHHPREWFIAPIAIIEKAIELMASNEAYRYEYNPALKMIVEKESKN